MTPFVLSQIPKEDLDLLDKIRKAVEQFPDGLEYGEDVYGKTILLSCHILAHAAGKVFELDVQDGTFAPIINIRGC